MILCTPDTPRSRSASGASPPCTCHPRFARCPPRPGILGGMPDGPSAPQAPVPGVVVVWTGALPTVQVFRVGAAGVVIGRELLQTTTDDRISRQHAKIVWRDKRFVVTDLGSRNGTYAGGHALIDRE